MEIKSGLYSINFPAQNDEICDSYQIIEEDQQNAAIKDHMISGIFIRRFQKSVCHIIQRSYRP